MSARPERPGWDWVARARALGGCIPLEMARELLAAGDAAVPLLVDVLARSDWRSGDDRVLRDTCGHAARLLGGIGSARALPALVAAVADPGRDSPAARESAWALSVLGVASFPPLERLLADRESAPWTRLRAGRALALAAVRDRRLRDRVRRAFERLLRDPLERERTVVSGVVDLSCRLAMVVLLPAVREAYASGRVDEGWAALEDVELDVVARHHRPDEELRRVARSDALEGYVPLDRLLAALDPEARVAAERALAEAGPVSEPPAPAEG